MNNGRPQPVSTASAPPVADGVLVRRFANCRDEAAFAELVARYRGLVYGVCRRVLQHRQDVEDAFQAAFLVLARDAADIRSRESIAAWLYGVAHRIALHARAKKSRRRETTLKETEVMGLPNPFAELAERSELQALDEELNLLPEKYREPLVLHYLLNRTAPQIAEELKLTQTAVEGRLKRGRNRLRKQLARRGIGLMAILPVLNLCQSSAEASLGSALVDQTIQAGLSFTSTGHSPPLYSHEAANLAAKEIGTMTTTSVGTFTAVALSATAIIGLAVGIAGQVPAPGRDGAPVGGKIALGNDSAQPEASKIIPVIYVGAVQAKRPAGAAAGGVGIGSDKGGIGGEAGGGVPRKPPAKPQTLDDVLKQRVKILEEFVKLARTAVRTGAADATAVLKAENEVLKAKLELARTPAERVAVRKEILNRIRQLQAPVKQAFAQGAITRTDVLRSELIRLEAEADLLREQAALQRKRGGVDPATSGVTRFGVGRAVPGMAGAGGGMIGMPNKSFDLKPRTPTEQKILAALESETKVDFDTGVSLKDAMSSIAERFKITIIPDKKPLDDAQIKLDELQTRVTLSGVKLRSVLNVILHEHQLDYVLRDEVLQITTVEAAIESLETRVYDTTPLKGLDPTALEKMVREETSGVWKDDGDPNGGSMTATSGALVVRQNWRVHTEISNLLQELARLSPEALKPPPATQSRQGDSAAGRGGLGGRVTPLGKGGGGFGSGPAGGGQIGPGPVGRGRIGPGPAGGGGAGIGPAGGIKKRR